MKGILIDPANRSVEALESPEFELAELHRLIGALTLDFCHPFGLAETMAVDDNGAILKLTSFRIEGFEWPIFRRAIIFGRGAGGETVSSGLSVEEVYDSITWPGD
jgi:hypothetical protein